MYNRISRPGDYFYEQYGTPAGGNIIAFPRYYVKLIRHDVARSRDTRNGYLSAPRSTDMSIRLKTPRAISVFVA